MSDGNNGLTRAWHPYPSTLRAHMYKFPSVAKDSTERGPYAAHGWDNISYHLHGELEGRLGITLFIAL